MSSHSLFPQSLRLSIFSSSSAIRPHHEVYTLSRTGEGRVWDLGARRIFSALRLKILMPGAKNRRQALRSHTPALSHPGEGIELLASVDLPCSMRKSTVSGQGEGINQVLA